MADELRFNRDPFDALVVAAALTMGIPLVTRDREIAQAGRVRTIW
jgi:PIN domain nuclease of toxin-antitoxin system